MSKGGMEIDHHMGELGDMPFLIVIVTCTIVVQFYARKIGRQHSICCWRDLCSWPNDMVTVFYWTLSVQKDSEVSYWCWPGMWCIGQLYTLFWILSESGTAYCLSWRHLQLVRHCVYCVLTLSSLFSPSDENIQLGTLGEEFELAEDIWWREHIKLWVLGQQDALALWGQWSYLSILFVWRFGWWDVSVLWGQYLHHRHRALWVGVYHLRGRHRCSFSDFDHRLQEQPYLYATLLYIVDWLLQWSKDYSDTTVFGWPTLWMSNGTFYSILKFEAVRCYLYVESWFGDGTLCSDYVLYPEEGCTDTLCESLRSWEVSQQAV